MSRGSKVRARINKDKAKKEAESAGDAAGGRSLNPIAVRIKAANDAVAEARAAIEHEDLVGFLVERRLRSVILGPPLPDDANADQIADALRLVAVANDMAANPDRVRRNARRRVAAAIVGKANELGNVNQALASARHLIAQCGNRPQSDFAAALATDLTVASTPSEIEAALRAISHAPNWAEQYGSKAESGPAGSNESTEPSSTEAIEAVRARIVQRLTELDLIGDINLKAREVAIFLIPPLAADTHEVRVQGVHSAVVMAEEVAGNPDSIGTFMGRVLRSRTIAGNSEEISELNLRLERARGHFARESFDPALLHLGWAQRILNRQVTTGDSPFTVMEAMTVIAWVWRVTGKTLTRSSAAPPVRPTPPVAPVTKVPSSGWCLMTPGQANRRPSTPEITHANLLLDEAVDVLGDEDEKLLELIDELTGEVLVTRLPANATYAALAAVKAALDTVWRLISNEEFARHRGEQLERAKSLSSHPRGTSDFSHQTAAMARRLRGIGRGPAELRSAAPQTPGWYLDTGIKPGDSIARILTVVIAFDQAQRILADPR